MAAMWLDSDVAGEHDDRVLEVHGATLAIREATVVEHLEEDVPHVGVGLLDLVEEDDAVGAPAYGLGELAALLESHVAGWRADQTRDRVLLHVLAHVEADHGPLVVEQELGEGTRELRLADAGWPEEEEAADGPALLAEARARAPHGVRDGDDCLFLPDDTLA